MSTKIYYAYKSTINGFSSFLSTYRAYCLSNVTKAINRFARSILSTEELIISENIRVSALIKCSTRIIKSAIVLNRAYHASSSRLRDTEIDFDCSLNMWLYKRHIYSICYGESWIFNEFKPPIGSVEYSYYNNTDHPDNLTYRQWCARRNTWEKVCLNDWNCERLVHEIINVSRQVGIYELGRCLRVNPWLLQSACEQLRDR